MRRFTFSRAVVPLEIRFVLMTLINVTLTGCFPMAGDGPDLVIYSRSLIDQQRTGRIRKPTGRHQLRAGRVRVVALIKPENQVAIFLVLGKRACDYHRRADPGQGEEPSSRFLMETNAAVGMRHRPDKPLVKSLGWREFAPVSHRITSVRLASPTALLLFAVNREVALWG